MYNYTTNRNKRLEIEIIDLNKDLEKSNKKNEELEAEIISLKENPEKSNKKNEELEAKIISLKADLEASNKKNEELLQFFEEQENGLKEEILKLNDQVE